MRPPVSRPSEPLIAPEGSGETGGQPTIPSRTTAQTAVRTAPADTALDPVDVSAKKPRENNPEKDGSQLWLRRWNLSVGPNEGGKDKGENLSDLAFEFKVEKALNSTPYSAVITVYNIDDKTVARMAKELTVVHLDAGYRLPSTQYGEVFHGPIVYYKFGRLDATDKFVEIHALQQDVEINRAKINAALDAGHTQEDVVKACIAVMGDGKVKLGQVPAELAKVQATRARVMHGMARDVLRDVARTFDSTVFLDDRGYLHILKEGEPLKEGYESVPVLNSRTGLIGVPTQVLGAGVEVRSLLNPNLNPGHQLKLANKDINALVDTHEANVSAGRAVETVQSLQTGAKLDSDGIYVVGTVRHWGHNRANPWYSDVSTKPLDPSKPGVQPGIVTSV